MFYGSPVSIKSHLTRFFQCFHSLHVLPKVHRSNGFLRWRLRSGHGRPLADSTRLLHYISDPVGWLEHVLHHGVQLRDHDHRVLGGHYFEHLQKEHFLLVT